MRSQELRQIECWLDEFLWPEPDGRLRNKRVRILSAATEGFLQLGYRKTSVDDVARRAGVAKGTIYLYYRNKAELLFHSAALEERTYLRHFAALLDAELEPVERLAALIELRLTQMADMPLLARLSRGDGELTLALAEVDDSLLDRVNAVQTRFLTELIGAASGGVLSDSALEERARVLIDLIAAVMAGGRSASRALSVQAYTRLVADMLVYGISRPQESGAPRLADAPGPLDPAPDRLASGS